MSSTTGVQPLGSRSQDVWFAGTTSPQSLAQMHQISSKQFRIFISILHIPYTVSCTQTLQKPKRVFSGLQWDFDQELQSGTSVCTITGHFRMLIHDFK